MSGSGKSQNGAPPSADEVEAVARAIFERRSLLNDLVGWNDVSGDVRERYRSMGQAAIAVTRQLDQRRRVPAHDIDALILCVAVAWFRGDISGGRARELARSMGRDEREVVVIHTSLMEVEEAGRLQKAAAGMLSTSCDCPDIRTVWTESVFPPVPVERRCGTCRWWGDPENDRLFAGMPDTPRRCNFPLPAWLDDKRPAVTMTAYGACSTWEARRG